MTIIEKQNCILASKCYLSRVLLMLVHTLPRIVPYVVTSGLYLYYGLFYKKTSTLISTDEAAYGISKWPNTSGCKTPIAPMC